MNEEQSNQLKNVLLSFASTVCAASDDLYRALERVDFSENHRLRFDGKYDVDQTYSDGVETEKKTCMCREDSVREKYKTDCGHVMEFYQVDEDFNFCPYCGGMMEIICDDSNS